MIHLFRVAYNYLKKKLLLLNENGVEISNLLGGPGGIDLFCICANAVDISTINSMPSNQQLVEQCLRKGIDSIFGMNQELSELPNTLSKYVEKDLLAYVEKLKLVEQPTGKEKDLTNSTMVNFNICEKEEEEEEEKKTPEMEEICSDEMNGYIEQAFFELKDKRRPDEYYTQKKKCFKNVF